LTSPGDSLTVGEMTRPIRVEFPGAVYHVTARGNERRKTFRDDGDRRQFLATLEETIRLHDLRLHGFCLMPNHYHLIVETPLGNLSRAIGWLQTTYTIRFNRRHRRSGHLFQGRFKAHVVDADSYSMELLRYVHLNPVRPRDKQSPIPTERGDDLKQYPWSSHRAYLGLASEPAWLCTQWLSFFGRRRSDAKRQYGRFVQDAFGESLPSPWRNLTLGLVLGGEALLERVRNLVGKKAGRQELLWVTRADNPETRQETARALASSFGDRSVKAWVRVTLGGERRVDVGQALGYKDGSAITHILKRLQARAAIDRGLRTELAKIQRAFACHVSRVDPEYPEYEDWRRRSAIAVSRHG
jgi:putative transposase